jgi:hypothetical protein
MGSADERAIIRRRLENFAARLGESAWDSTRGGGMREDARSALLGLIQGYWKSQIVHALASLSIAECLAEQSASLETLSEKTGANPDGLRRLLRGAASLG